MQIISFAHCEAHTLPIFAKLNIIQFSDLISLCNCYKHFSSKSPSVFSHVFIQASNACEQNTRFASHGLDKTNMQYFKIWSECFCCFCYSIMGFFPERVSQ